MNNEDKRSVASLTDSKSPSYAYLRLSFWFFFATILSVLSWKNLLIFVNLRKAGTSYQLPFSWCFKGFFISIFFVLFKCVLSIHVFLPRSGFFWPGISDLAITLEPSLYFIAHPGDRFNSLPLNYFSIEWKTRRTTGTIPSRNKLLARE